MSVQTVNQYGHTQDTFTAQWHKNTHTDPANIHTESIVTATLRKVEGPLSERCVLHLETSPHTHCHSALRIGWLVVIFNIVYLLVCLLQNI